MNPVKLGPFVGDTLNTKSYHHPFEAIRNMSSHQDDDPDKTQEEYDADNHADQENPNNDEYDKDDD
jgi:hypothetical protein